MPLVEQVEDRLKVLTPRFYTITFIISFAILVLVLINVCIQGNFQAKQTTTWRRPNHACSTCTFRGIDMVDDKGMVSEFRYQI